VKNIRTQAFRKRYAKLPPYIQHQAKVAYKLFKENPYHPSLHFKCINQDESFYSVRIGLHYRAVGLRDGNTIYWEFIGSHEEYNHLLS
jgi:mRNA-degrading endonuclease RelE of RelBE toxin-antitoxin system